MGNLKNGKSLKAGIFKTGGGGGKKITKGSFIYLFVYF